MAIILEEERLEDRTDTSMRRLEADPQKKKMLLNKRKAQEPTQSLKMTFLRNIKGKNCQQKLLRCTKRLRSYLGRQSSEVGELRKIVDDFVKSQLEAKTAPQQSSEEPEDDVDWYLDPQKAVSKAIENHPKIKEAEQVTVQMKQATSTV